MPVGRLRGRRGGRHQLPPAFPRSPGIIPAVLASTYFRPPRCDCSIKERGRQCGACAKFEAFVLYKFFTGETGEYLGSKLAHRLFTPEPCAAVGGFEFWVLSFGFGIARSV